MASGCFGNYPKKEAPGNGEAESQLTKELPSCLGAPSGQICCERIRLSAIFV